MRLFPDRQVLVLQSRTDQLLWQLRSLVNELDRPRKTHQRPSCRPASNKDKEADGEIGAALTLPEHLRAPLLAVDLHGRDILLRQHAQEEVTIAEKVGGDGDDGDFSDQDDGDDGPAPSTRRGRKRGAQGQAQLPSLGRLAAPRSTANKRLRSRNKVVDEWLDEEGGDDAYADLEDFLVA